MKNDLEKNGLRVFDDGPSSSEAWGTRSREGVTTSKVTLVLLSPDALQADHIVSDVRLAQDLNRPLIPVISRSFDINSLRSTELSQLVEIQILDMSRGKYEDNLIRLTEIIESLLAPPEGDNQAPTRKTQKRAASKSAAQSQTNLEEAPVDGAESSGEAGKPGWVRVTHEHNARGGPGLSYPITGKLEKDTLVEILEVQEPIKGETWGRIDPTQWVALGSGSLMRLPEPERPTKKYEYRQRGVVLRVAFSDKGWRMEGVDGLLVGSSLTLSGPDLSFFRSILDDIPSEEARADLKIYLQKHAETLPGTESPALIRLPPELVQILLPYSPPGKAKIVAAISSAPKIFDDEQQGEDYAQGLIKNAVSFAGQNEISHLVMPVLGSPSAAHIERTIQTLMRLPAYGSLKNITIVTISSVVANAARKHFRELEARDNNTLLNNRAQAVKNDKAQGDDQLGVKEEVDALTDTLLLRDVEPPVAVGVMGGWGSGKSFVMYLISKRVEETRAKKVKKGWPEPGKEKDPEIPSYVGHIYQINFNAWTYTKSNLWASLMDTIFSTLSWQLQLEQFLAHKDLKESDKIPELGVLQPCLLNGGNIYKKIYEEGYQPARDKDLNQAEMENLAFWSRKLLSKNLLWHVMRSRNEDTLKDLRENEEKLAYLKARREALEKNRVVEKYTPAVFKDDPLAKPAYLELLKTTLLGFVSDALGKSIRNELKAQNLGEKKLQDLKKETLDLLKGYQGLLAAFRQNKYYVYAAASFAILTLALPYVFAAFGQPILDHGVTKLVAFLAAAAPVVQAFVTRARKVLEFEQETQKAFEKAYETQRKRQADEIVADGTKTMDEKVAALEEAIRKGSLPALDALIALRESEIEQQRQQVGSSAKYASLLEFIQSRLDAATYETQLGLMHQVRKDIDELTYSLVENANPDIFPRGKPRVMLYIDDLDRCPPPRVVEVLEAVQLLLSTKLFIVVLGLDTRYVTRALEKEYKEILQHEGDPSGLDYIEKIIQIPYRVRPVEQKGLQKYLQTQMEIVADAAPATSAAENATGAGLQATGASPSASGASQPSGLPASGSGGRTMPGMEHKPSGAGMDEPGAEDEEETVEVDLPPEVIQFKPEDLADLTACCGRIALTPRSIKRLVNVLKLMKIFWFRTDQTTDFAERDRKRPVKQAVIALLALSSAYPEVMRETFVYFENLFRQGREQTELFQALNNVRLPPESVHEITWQFQKYKNDVEALMAITGEGQASFGQIKLGELGMTTFDLVRSFSFVGDPVYWGDGEDEQTRTAAQHPARRVVKINPN